MRILLLEDNLFLSELIQTHLSKSYVVDLAHNLQEARYKIDTKSYDLLIFDVVLPDGNSQELLGSFKENKSLWPILFLSADLDSLKKINCLQNGDDYLAKPFSILELESRIKILLKQNQENKLISKIENVKHKDFELDTQSHSVRLNSKEIKLNRKEFLLLELLLKNYKQVLSRAILAEKIWQSDEVLFGNSIETTITNLRRKIGKKLIETVKGVGYVIRSL